LITNKILPLGGATKIIEGRFKLNPQWTIGFIAGMVLLNALLGGVSSLVLSLVLSSILIIRYQNSWEKIMADSYMIRSLLLASFFSCAGLAGILHYCADAFKWGI